MDPSKRSVEPVRQGEETEQGSATKKQKLVEASSPREKLTCSSLDKNGKAGGSPPVKQDPVLVLSEDVCMEIFSFLCDKPKLYGSDQIDPQMANKEITTFRWLRQKAGKLYATLRSVSPLWKKTFDRVAWADYAGLLHVSLDLLTRAGAVSLIQWLCNYKIRLAYLIAPMGSASQLLKECPTNELEQLRISEGFGSNAEIAVADKALQDIIAHQCPNLKVLVIGLGLPTNTPIYRNYVSENLFSCASITGLTLSVTYFDDSRSVDPKWGTETPVEQNIFTHVIRKLPNLKNLWISGVSSETEGLCSNRRFHIASESLEYLDALHLPKGMVLSIDCPRLRHFFCDGGPEGSGWLPRHNPQGNFQIATNGRSTDGSICFKVPGHYRCPNFRVAEGCLMELQNFSWSPQEYELFRLRCQQFSNAAYQTFEGEEA